MRFPFRLKLVLAISVVAVGMVVIAVSLTYIPSKDSAIRLMGGRLKDLGRAASYMFGPQERQDIKKLSKLINDSSFKTGQLNKTIIEKKYGQGDYSPTLSETMAESFHETPEYQRLIQVLRTVKNASRDDVVYPQKFKQLPIDKNDLPLIQYTYLFIKAKGVQHPESENFTVLKFLADADYDIVDHNGDGKISEEEEEQSNQIGNLYIISNDKQDFFLKAFDGEVAAARDFYKESFGTLFSAAVPITDESGNVIAIFGMDYKADTEADAVEKLFQTSVIIVIISLVISIVVALFMGWYFNRPIEELRKGAERVRARDFDTQIEIKSRDELGLLADTFNGMVKEIKEYAHGLEQLSDAYYRFVPREFLNHLERESILDVQLGDQVQRDMTVLFSDIREFTSLSEGMTPDENFNFINGYLGNMSPIIREYNGFVDKYIGDAVMALFPEKIEDAVNAGIQMHKQLRKYNVLRRSQGYARIKIGIGMHTGLLKLGTVGEELRMESTVISDAVNLASRLEGMTKKFGSGLIISETMRDAVADQYELRYLGRVKIKGKTGSAKIFEVLDADSEMIRDVKLEFRQRFEEGVEMFQRGNYDESARIFSEVYEVNPLDVAVKAYIDQCARFAKLRARR